MPTDIDNSDTRGELMLAIAEDVRMASYGSAGTGPPQLPTDQTSLWRLRRFVNQGYKRLLRSDPHFSFLRRTIAIQFNTNGNPAISVNGENWRYRLPFWVRGNPRRKWTYMDATSLYESLTVVPEELVLRRRQYINHSDVPTMGAVRRIPEEDLEGEPQGTCELIVYPNPSGNYNISVPYRVVPYDLLDDDEAHLAGHEHNETIAKCAIWEWALGDLEDPAEKEDRRREMNEALAFSIRIDQHQRPSRRRPLYNDMVEHNVRDRGRTLISKVGDRSIEDN